MPDTAAIFEGNLDTLAKLGLAGWQALGRRPLGAEAGYSLTQEKPAAPRLGELARVRSTASKPLAAVPDAVEQAHHVLAAVGLQVGAELLDRRRQDVARQLLVGGQHAEHRAEQVRVGAAQAWMRRSASGGAARWPGSSQASAINLSAFSGLGRRSSRPPGHSPSARARLSIIYCKAMPKSAFLHQV
jgi:hypothetical protein